MNTEENKENEETQADIEVGRVRGARNAIERKPNVEMRRAVRTLGGLAAAASKLGISESSLSQFSYGGRPLPIPRAVQIERKTRGLHTAERLLPRYRAMFAYLRSTGEIS